MPTTRSGELDIFYETFGDPEEGVPLLLVVGLGGQCLDWEEELCFGLVDRGFFVIRFDNRDAGLSSKLDDHPVAAGALEGLLAGERPEVPYLLSDMAADAVAVLDAAGIERAHVVGRSLGGMIAQTMAIEHPERVESLVSIMSTTGEPAVGQPDPAVLPLILAPPPTDAEAAVERAVVLLDAYGSPDHYDPERIRARYSESFARNYCPDGTARQLFAMLASGDRSQGLAALDLPALVIHGDADRLIDLSGGRRTAELIPGAALEVIEGMGHDLPPQLWSQLIEALVAHVVRAASGADSAQR